MKKIDLGREFPSGKHAGKSVLLTLGMDPQYIEWAAGEPNIFGGSLYEVLQTIVRLGENVPLPMKDRENWLVEHVSYNTGGYHSFGFVEATSPPHQGSSRTFRAPTLDLFIVPRLNRFDRGGVKPLWNCFRSAYGRPNMRLTRDRLAAFFSELQDIEAGKSIVGLPFRLRTS
jgi:hypothetical protein